MPLALPFKHDTVGAGAIAGVGKIGKSRHSPSRCLQQYRFLEADAKIRPVGLGLTYAKFFKERGTAALTIRPAAPRPTPRCSALNPSSASRHRSG